MGPKRKNVRDSKKTGQETHDQEHILKRQASEDVDAAELKKITAKIRQFEAKRQSKFSAVRKAHTDRVTKAHEDIARHFADHNKKANAIRKKQLERLCSLLKRKRELEWRMLKLAECFEKDLVKNMAIFKGVLNKKIRQLRP